MIEKDKFDDEFDPEPFLDAEGNLVIRIIFNKIK